MSISPPSWRTQIGGSPVIGGPATPLRMMRRRPGRSGTSSAPSGRISTSHGFSRPVDDGLDTERRACSRCHDAGRQRRRPGARQRCAGGAFAQLADVDHHRADVLVVQRRAERRHRRARPPVLDAGGELGVTAAVRPGVVEQARRRAAAAVGAVAAGAHLSEGGDDAARRLRRLREESRRGHCRAEKGRGERRTGKPSGHGQHCMCVGRGLRRSSRRGACRARDTAWPAACWPRRRRRSRP